MKTEDITIADLRQLLIENCLLKVAPEEILDDTPLFGPDSLGLDSLDAMQIAVAIEQKYGTPIHDPALARQVIKTLASIREWLIRATNAV